MAGVGDEKLAMAVGVHPVDPEAWLEAVEPGVVLSGAAGDLPSGRRVSDQELGLGERVGILEEVAVLAIGVDALGQRLADRRDELHALGLLLPAARIDDRELAGLDRVMPGGDGDGLVGARDGPRVEQCGGEPGVVAVVLGLGRAVGVHLEQPLGEDLATVAVVPARVEHAAVVGDCWVVVVDLVEGQAAEVPAVSVACVEVADLGPPAVDRLDAAGGVEDDGAIGQVRALVVGEAQAVGELPDAARGEIHLVEVVVILAVGLLPREQHPLPVEGDIGVTDDPVRILE